jgi:hypothetical protein
VINLTCCHVKSSRIDEQFAAFLPVDLSQFRKSEEKNFNQRKCFTYFIRLLYQSCTGNIRYSTPVPVTQSNCPTSPQRKNPKYLSFEIEMRIKHVTTNTGTTFSSQEMLCTENFPDSLQNSTGTPCRPETVFYWSSGKNEQ